MAEIALDHADAPEIEKLARAIRDAQGDEIEQMKRIHQRLFDARLKPDEGAHAALGLSMQEAGTGHDGTMMQELANAKPFDRAFVDEMVPHHQGAVEMAEVLREIAAMNDFRTEQYGGPVRPKNPSEHGEMKMDGE